MSIPKAPQIRFSVEPGDVSPEKAARRLHLTLPEFNRRLPALLARNFPPPDPTTGNFDLDAIDRWRRLRHPNLFPELLTSAPVVGEPKERRPDLGEMFLAAKERRRRA